MLAERLDVGSSYTLNINWEDRSLALKGTVVSEQLAGSEENRDIETGPVYIIGISFDKSSVQDNKDFESFINEFTGPNAPKGLARHVRLKIASGRKGTSGDQPFQVSQISFGGMQLTAHEPFEVDSNINLELLLPGASSTIKFLGRVANCKDISSGSLKTYQVGIEYLDMKTRDLQQIKDIIYQIEQL